MKQTLTLFLFGCVAFSNLALAKETAESIENSKQKIVQYIDAEIEILTQFKACIQTAKGDTDFELCKKSKNTAQTKKILEMKKDRLDERKKELDMAEKKLNDSLKSDKK